jgi:hypothetical protein
MDGGTDFIAFYRELGIAPECTPEELKRAYRRRVSGLHPDRVGDRGGGEEALKSLNLGYAAALEFHRTHGRFPGAASNRSAPSASRSMVRESHRDRTVDTAGDDDAPRHPRWLLLALVLLLVILVASQLMDSDATSDAGEGTAPAAFAGAPTHGVERKAPLASLQVGMLPGEVLALVGAPMETHDDGRHWLYGPSWVRVVCGQLTDWYSSPLKPLAGSRTRPGLADVRDDYRPKAHCVEATTPAAMAY